MASSSRHAGRNRAQAHGEAAPVVGRATLERRRDALEPRRDLLVQVQIGLGQRDDGGGGGYGVEWSDRQATNRRKSRR